LSKIIEVKRFILCQRCLYIFEEWSIGSRFHDIVCPNCHKIIWLTYAFKDEYEANEKKEKLLKRREGKATKEDETD
jgi:hydrogenase maturation factor HypF (carbamoyltransferase family)